MSTSTSAFMNGLLLTVRSSLLSIEYRIQDLRFGNLLTPFLILDDLSFHSGLKEIGE